MAFLICLVAILGLQTLCSANVEGQAFAGMTLFEAREAFAKMDRSDQGEPKDWESIAKELGYGIEAPTPPPESGFELIKYDAPLGQNAALITPIPKDWKDDAIDAKKPAIIWVHMMWGGISAALWDEATWPSPKEEDGRIPRVFLKEDIVVMCPSFRGDNTNPGKFEMLLGEVDDLNAAIQYLAKRPNVDPERIYLAGHVQGASLVLLAAELLTGFRAVFAISPVLDVEREVQQFGTGWAHAPFVTTDALAGMIRSPMPWPDTITQPTIVFEPHPKEEADQHEMQFLEELEDMAKLASQSEVPFQSYSIPGEDHFSIYTPVTELIVELIKIDDDAEDNALFDAELVQEKLNLLLNGPEEDENPRSEDVNGNTDLETGKDAAVEEDDKDSEL